MVQPFRVPFNVPKGTAVSDGYRIAPKFSTLSTTTPNSSGQLYSKSSFNNYGPGMLVSPDITWNFTPYPTTLGNLRAAAAVTGNSWLTLTGDNGAATRIGTTNVGMFPPGAPNEFYIQLDWPRVPSVTVAGADLAANVNVTFFGFDFYDNPLQHTYVVRNQGTYPGAINNGVTQAGKAFYKITAIRFNGATAVGGTISCQVSNTFGLPFKLKTYSDVKRWGWADSDMLSQGGKAKLNNGVAPAFLTPIAHSLTTVDPDPLGNTYPQILVAHTGALPDVAALGVPYVADIVAGSYSVGGSIEFRSSSATDDSVLSWTVPNGGKFLMAMGDNTAPSATTGDVRGLIELPFVAGTNTAEYYTLPVDGNRKCIFSYYCEGFDEWLTIQNAGQQPQQNGVPYTFPDGTTNNIVPPNLAEDMYGLPQYYTGVAAT